MVSSALLQARGPNSLNPQTCLCVCLCLPLSVSVRLCLSVPSNSLPYPDRLSTALSLRVLLVRLHYRECFLLRANSHARGPAACSRLEGVRMTDVVHSHAIGWLCSDSSVYHESDVLIWRRVGDTNLATVSLLTRCASSTGRHGVSRTTLQMSRAG